MSSSTAKINSPAWTFSRIVTADGNEKPRHLGPSRLVGLLVVAAWVALGLAANVFLLLAPSKSDSRTTSSVADAAAVASNKIVGQAFPGTGTDAIAYLVLDGHDPLGPADQQYYESAINALRADSAHVGSVLDWWTDPLTAPLGTSPDQRSGIAVLWLRGDAGTSKARQSLDSARSVLRKLPASPGLRARITVPATTAYSPVRLSVWQAAGIVAVAALVAALLVLRAGLSARSVAAVLLTGALSVAVAWPLTYFVGASSSMFSGVLAAVLTVGLLATSTVVVARQEPRSYRDTMPAFGLPGAGALLLTIPLLFAQTPEVRSVGLATPGVVAALAASLTLLPALIRLAGAKPEGPASLRGPSWKRSLPVPRPALVVAVVLAICALPVIGADWGLSRKPVGSARTGGAHFLASNRLPDVVLIKSGHDLRDPGGLIGIDAVSRRLMDIPGVRKVQSAAWPAGVPWSDASLSSAAGRLSEQLDRQAATFVPQVTAIKTLATVLDQVSGSVEELESTLTAGVGGLNQMQQAINMVVSGTRNIKDTATEISGYLDPVRGWMGGIPDCSADILCRTARKAVDPIDRVIADITVLSDGADRIAAGSTRAAGALTSTPRAVAQMRSALTQLRSFVPSLETTIESTIPQVVQLSAFLKNLSIDFADTGEGGFYLPRKALADPSYQHVRQTMFSSDGTATRLFVYSDETALDLNSAERVGQIETAVGNATKYGSLVDSEVTVTGGARLAAVMRSTVTHDAILLAGVVLALALLVSLWRGAARGLAVGLGLVGSWLAGLGITVGLCEHLLFRAVDASVGPASFAILAACGFPYLVAALFTDSLVSARSGLAALPAVGGVFGLGLVVAAGGSVGTAGQIGTATVLGLLALTVLARVCFPTASRVETGPPSEV